MAKGIYNMAKGQKKQEAQVEQSEVVSNERGVMKFRVLKDVLGYKAGDEFESSYHAVRLQVKHRSIEPV